jgi:ornithine--oxo-acid transaminase
MNANIASSRSAELIELEDRWGAHNYHPLPVVVERAEGPWLYDVDGKRYLDCLSAYSAVNQGHAHPRILETLIEQAKRVTLTSRAFRNDQLPLFCEEVAQLCDMDRVLPMNTGAEAVETAIKAARRWGYEKKGIAPDRAEIIVCANNFHGRTTTIVSFSTDPDARDDFGPYTPGFRIVSYGDRAALAQAVDENTVAVLLEPIQGEAGVLVPPDGYFAAVRALCDERNVLLLADEIQSGLGRTGRTFAIEHDGVAPDMYILGKALGGGIVPVSAVAANSDVLGVLRPGEHGSTFGGNPLACAVGTEVVRLLAGGEFQKRSAVLGEHLHAGLHAMVGQGIVAVRGRGLWAGVDIDPALMTGRQACERLAENGVLAKDTHGSTIRLAPPLVVTEAELDLALAALAAVIAEAA